MDIRSMNFSTPIMKGGDTMKLRKVWFVDGTIYHNTVYRGWTETLFSRCFFDEKKAREYAALRSADDDDMKMAYTVREEEILAW